MSGSGRKRKVLTLEDRVKVVDRLTSGKSARSIAASLGVGKTQIQAIGKEKEIETLEGRGKRQPEVQQGE